MDAIRINPISIKNDNFTGKSKPVKHFQMQKSLENTAETANLCPSYFHPSFGIKNPKSALCRAQKLKEFFNNKGYPYLLPHEIWSDKKISAAIKSFGKILDKLAEEGKIGKETLQEAIDDLIPEHIKGKIKVKTYSELKKDLENENYSEQQIQKYMTNKAATFYSKDSDIIFLNFEKLDGSKAALIDFKADAQHELTHALKGRLKNTRTIDLYNNEEGKCDKHQKIFNFLFSSFENNYHIAPEYKPVKLTKENMLDWQGFDSIEELHKNFETVLDNRIETAGITGEFDLGLDTKSWKQFYSFMKHRAQGEKQAYQSEIRYRELNGDKNIPTDAELRPILYEEMEKFFAKKERQFTTVHQE